MLRNTPSKHRLNVTKNFLIVLGKKNRDNNNKEKESGVFLKENETSKNFLFFAVIFFIRVKKIMI